MISTFLAMVASASAGVINTGSGLVDLFANLPAGLIYLAASGLAGIGS